MSKENYKQFGDVFGRSIHTIETAKVDLSHGNKPEELQIKTPATLATIKSVTVNTMRLMKVEGGIEVVVINGGEREVKIGAAEKLIKKSSDYISEHNKPQWFGNHKTAVELCNVSNRGEINRLESIKNDLENQITALKDINSANERMLAAFSED